LRASSTTSDFGGHCRTSPNPASACDTCRRVRRSDKPGLDLVADRHARMPSRIFLRDMTCFPFAMRPLFAADEFWAQLANRRFADEDGGVQSERFAVMGTVGCQPSGSPLRPFGTSYRCAALRPKLSLYFQWRPHGHRSVSPPLRRPLIFPPYSGSSDAYSCFLDLVGVCGEPLEALLTYCSTKPTPNSRRPTDGRNLIWAGGRPPLRRPAERLRSVPLRLSFI
jgi:hypothetical protein